MPLDHARTITQTEYDDIWKDAEESGEAVWQQVDVERQLLIPKQLGRGGVRSIELQPGLNITITTCVCWRPVYLDYCMDSDGEFCASFYLAGSRRMINPGIQLEDDREEAAGETCLCYLADMRSIEHFPAERLLKSLTVNIDLERLYQFGLLEEAASPLLQSLTQGKPLKRFHQSLNPITPNLQQILQQILDCPYHGAVKRMYLEGKALELLSLQFHQLTSGQRLSQIPSKLCPADIERLQLAREILQQRFDQPPSLLALARQVGLNDFKLKQGFRHLFGTTVFGYVQTCRMEQAQQLLGDFGLSIASIAWRVGYTSPSRFCKVFKRHTGMTPSKYRRRFRV